jgi:hypothetical protein
MTCTASRQAAGLMGLLDRHEMFASLENRSSHASTDSSLRLSIDLSIDIRHTPVEGSTRMGLVALHTLLFSLLTTELVERPRTRFGRVENALLEYKEYWHESFYVELYVEPSFEEGKPISMIKLKVALTTVPTLISVSYNSGTGLLIFILRRDGETSEVVCDCSYV